MEIGAHASLGICNNKKCDWCAVQGEEHIILDCYFQDFTDMHTQFQLLFNSAPLSSASRLRDFMNQADVLGLAKSDWFGSRHLFLLQLSCPCRRGSDICPRTKAACMKEKSNVPIICAPAKSP
eukprot:1151794-Pelagomonas_calceolata.AAC.1